MLFGEYVNDTIRGICYTLSCYLVAALEEHQLRQQLLYNYKFQSKVLHMCCVPKEYRPLFVVYMDDDGIVNSANIPDMVVASCQCM